MRLWLRIPAETLRRALADLLSAAGHEVFTGQVPPPEPDLQILMPAEGDPPLSGRAALYLRPGPRRPVSPDPAAALRRALETSGIAVWSPPLDPAMLLDVVGVVTPSARTESATPRPSLLASPSPWLILDVASRRVVWANGPASERLGIGGRSDPVPEAVPTNVYARPEGREQTDFGGRSALAVWWTEPDGRRCVGLLDLPSTDRAEAGNIRALAEIGRMTSTFAHEVRNPIAALAGAIDLLREDLAPLERAEVAGLAKERLALMRRLLDDMLRLARPLRGDPQDFDLGPVIESTVAATRTDPAFQGIELKVDLGTQALRVRAHAEPFRQAVTNLLLNAAEAQEGRGVIRVRMTTDGAVATVRVEDEGPGIAPERREMVFDPFWTTKPKGTGLGLAFVRRVAEAAGGRALVEESAVGATIRVDLPLAM